MKRFHWRNLWCVATVLSITGSALADEPVQVPRVTGTAPARALSSGAVSVAVVGGDVQELGKYWIGVSVTDVGDALRDQLDLQNGLGVVASDIVDKGPAQTAGILKHDILLKAGETELRSAKDLVAAVNKAEANDLAVELIRKGQRKTITVKPAERPAAQGLMVVGGGGPGVLPQRLKGLNGEEIEIRVGPGGNAFFMQPGVPLPVPGPGMRIANAPAPVPLPNGVSISISRTNNDPAKISVKRGAESWDVTDKELDKLPAELRPHVERMLNPQSHPIFVPHTAWQPNNPLTPRTVIAPKIDNEGAKKSDVDQLKKQLEELSRKFDQLNEKK